MQRGDRWKDWEAVELLGTGSFGKVFRIVRRGYNGFTEESALKVIRIPKDPSDYQSVIDEGMTKEGASLYFESIVNDFSKEFRLMSRLKGNSNIVSFEDYEVAQLKDDFGWEIFIRMELLTPLTQYIAHNSMTEADVAGLGTDICRALELCETEKIIHRDIKPQNIFVSKHGDFKLGDFGIARKLESAQDNMTRIGSLSYMAPEVYRGEPYTSKVDIYSLGLVLYRLLNNNRGPFLPLDTDKITYGDKDQARGKRLAGTPLPPPVNASEDMAEAVLRACAFDPEDRFRDASDMRRALEDAVSSSGKSRALPSAKTAEETTQTISDEDATVMSGPSAGIFGADGKKKIYAAAAAVVILVVAIAAAAGSGNDNSQTERKATEQTEQAEQTETAEDSSGTSADDAVKARPPVLVEGTIDFPEYDGETVSVSSADEFLQAVRSADEGTTIEVASGEYSFDGPISINTSDIRVLGKGKTRPVIDCAISIGGSGVMLENIDVKVTDVSKADGSDMGRCVYVESLSGGASYMKDCNIVLRYHGENLQYGVEITSPLYMSGCTIDVSDTNDDFYVGYICVGMGSKFVPENCLFRSNDAALGLWPAAEGEYTEADLENILNSNTFKARIKMSR